MVEQFPETLAIAKNQGFKIRIFVNGEQQRRTPPILRDEYRGSAALFNLMPTDLIVANRSQDTEIGPLAEIAGRASDFIRESKAANTIRAYQADWEHFTGWCEDHGQIFLPASADCVALYLTDLSATHKPATLTRQLSAISQAHQIAGLESPTRATKVKLVMAGIRRKLGTAHVSKAPALVDNLKRMISRLPDGLIGARDRALLLIGFCGAFRRSELVALDRDAVEITNDSCQCRNGDLRSGVCTGLSAVRPCRWRHRGRHRGHLENRSRKTGLAPPVSNRREARQDHACYPASRHVRLCGAVYSPTAGRTQHKSENRFRRMERRWPEIGPLGFWAPLAHLSAGTGQWRSAGEPGGGHSGGNFRGSRADSRQWRGLRQPDGHFRPPVTGFYFYPLCLSRQGLVTWVFAGTP